MQLQTCQHATEFQVNTLEWTRPLSHQKMLPFVPAGGSHPSISLAKWMKKICLVEELHVAMQGDAVRLMGSEISEFHLVSAERAKNAGAKLHPHQYPTSSGDQNQLLC